MVGVMKKLQYIALVLEPAGYLVLQWETLQGDDNHEEKEHVSLMKVSVVKTGQTSVFSVMDPNRRKCIKLW